MPSTDLPLDARSSSVTPAGVVALVESALRGDRVGWDGLFDRFHPVVYRYALARTGDRSAAEEIAQEVFVAATRTLPRLRERSEAGIEGWFVAIARNKLADRARRRSVEERMTLLHDSGPDAAEVATTRLAAAELRAAMEDITEEQREVLLRRFVLDQSLEHVAAATGRRVGAVKALQHRALAALERRLGREWMA
ncbi:MAG TPA: RNA polymerase sigma factor [Candidatus Dormibacteraeota bacterium]|nr:RNA polymerase sigma factor [Candidatus Dormibacteraeota bacterium]